MNRVALGMVDICTDALVTWKMEGVSAFGGCHRRGSIELHLKGCHVEVCQAEKRKPDRGQAVQSLKGIKSSAFISG